MAHRMGVGSYLVRPGQNQHTVGLSILAADNVFRHYRVALAADGRAHMMDVPDSIVFPTLNTFLYHYKSAKAVATRLGPSLPLSSCILPESQS